MTKINDSKCIIFIVKSNFTLLYSFELAISIAQYTVKDRLNSLSRPSVRPRVKEQVCELAWG